MKETQRRSSVTMRMSPVNRPPRPSMRRAPVEHLAAGKMAAATHQRHGVVDGKRFARPEADRRRRALDPLALGLVEIDGNAAEGVAPLDHGRVVVRVGDGDGREAAAFVHLGDGLVGDQADAIPQHVAGGRLEQQSALVDGEGRRDAEAGDAIGLIGDLDAVVLLAARRGSASPGRPSAHIGDRPGKSGRRRAAHRYRDIACRTGGR